MLEPRYATGSSLSAHLALRRKPIGLRHPEVRRPAAPAGLRRRRTRPCLGLCARRPNPHSDARLSGAGLSFRLWIHRVRLFRESGGSSDRSCANACTRWGGPGRTLCCRRGVRRQHPKVRHSELVGTLVGQKAIAPCLMSIYSVRNWRATSGLSGLSRDECGERQSDSLARRLVDESDRKAGQTTFNATASHALAP